MRARGARGGPPGSRARRAAPDARMKDFNVSFSSRLLLLLFPGLGPDFTRVFFFTGSWGVGKKMIQFLYFLIQTIKALKCFAYFRSVSR